MAPPAGFETKVYHRTRAGTPGPIPAVENVSGDGSAVCFGGPPVAGRMRVVRNDQGVGRLAHRLSKLQLTSWTTSPVFSTSAMVPTPRA